MMINLSTKLLLIPLSLGLSLSSGCRLASKTVNANALQSTEQENLGNDGLRPHIDNVKDKAMPQRTQEWKSQLQALTLLTIQVSEMNPGAEIYYLARDMEYAYDLSQLFDNAKSRSHLLKLSRSNAKDHRTPEYLKQEGISEETLSQGRKVVLVDSGWRGSIPKYLRSLFSEAAGNNIKTQLLHSRNGDYASTSVALAALQPALVTISPNDSHDEIVKIERLPHFESRYDSFLDAVDPATGQPIIKPHPKAQGEAKEMSDSPNAVIHMRDLKAWAQERENIDFHEKWSTFWKEAFKSVLYEHPDMLSRAIDAIYSEMNSYKERSILEGALKDLAERSTLGQIDNAPWLKEKYQIYRNAQVKEHNFHKWPAKSITPTFAAKDYRILGDFAAETKENGRLVLETLINEGGFRHEIDTVKFEGFIGPALRRHPDNAEYLLSVMAIFSFNTSENKVLATAVDALIGSKQTARLSSFYSMLQDRIEKTRTTNSAALLAPFLNFAVAEYDNSPVAKEILNVTLNWQYLDKHRTALELIEEAAKKFGLNPELKEKLTVSFEKYNKDAEGIKAAKGCAELRNGFETN